MMKNRDIYLRDPATRKLVNEGVASVNDATQDVLRYELETFVCEGQYEKGLAHILETYLKNINQAQQPGVWVSGFYGSGKSHLVKMLGALWINTQFADGATARGIADIPQSIKDLLAELTIRAKQYGGIHVASGTLGAGASGSVRLALLNIIFKSACLPEQYGVARFVMWLKQEGIYDQIKEHVAQNGFNWNEELDNFYVAEGLHAALMKVKPNLFASQPVCVETLNNLYPRVQDVSNDEMLKALRSALMHAGKFPLTLIVLDEVQQYIGEDSKRSIEVQEAVESCCKNIGGKLLFIGTGQTAVTGTSNLKKLEGRFTIRIELSDADVDTVIRKVILAKKPEAIASIEQVMQTNLGEISRHLADTSIGHRQNDIPCFSKDYPILPVRRRFWESTLRVLDRTGTDSQLRNQLSMVHKVIQTNLDAPIGSIVPADYLYFDSAERLLQSRILPRRVHEKTFIWNQGTGDERILARACGLVFLINKLGNSNEETGIKATADVLADLLVEDLLKGSGNLRSKLPALLDNCELLMKVGDEYRIQTEESTAWNDEFLSQRHNLANEMHRIEAERDDRIRKMFGETMNKFTLPQGTSGVTRDIFPLFDNRLPADANTKIYIWVRNGWSTSDNSVRADARMAGNQSPVIFIFIPKRSADDLRHHLINYKAATATLDKKGVPNTPEGAEARSAMETTRLAAESKIHELLNEALSGTRVFQGGGNEIPGTDLREIVMEAAANALVRLYPHFAVSDNPGWSKVYEKSRKGAPDALNAVGYSGEPANNPVCKQVSAFIAGGKRGSDIRSHFESAPYGWSRDTVDGALQVLLLSGAIRIDKVNGSSQNIPHPTELERKTIGLADFKIEAATVTISQRLQVRKLLQVAGITVKQGEESVFIPEFLQRILDLTRRAGGEAPKPEFPDAAFINSVRLSSGNEQLILLYNNREELMEKINTWSGISEQIDKRWSAWILLEQLAAQAQGVPDADIIQSQVQCIVKQRLLLEEPDPVTPLLAGLTQILRGELNFLKAGWEQEWNKGEARLEADSNWQQLEPEQRHALRLPHGLIANATPQIEVKDAQTIRATLETAALSALKDRIAAMPGRYDSILLNAAKLLEPEAKEFLVPRRTLRTHEEVERWVEEVKQSLERAMEKGPVVIR